jgi:hypothetical protein
LFSFSFAHSVGLPSTANDLNYFGIMFLCLELSIATLLAFYWTSAKVASPSTISTIAKLLSGNAKRKSRNPSDQEARAKNIQGQATSGEIGGDVLAGIRQNQAEVKSELNDGSRLVVDANDLLDNPSDDKKSVCCSYFVLIYLLTCLFLFFLICIYLFIEFIYLFILLN